MISPKADSKLLWFLFRGLVLFSFSELLLEVEFFISSIFLVFETKGIKLLTTGFVSTDFGTSTSTVWLLLNSSIVMSPPNTFSRYLHGADITLSSLPPYILRRIITIFEHTRLPLPTPYLSNAYVFIQLHEQKFPVVSNFLRRSSYFTGIFRGVPSKGWQHHQHHICLRTIFSLSLSSPTFFTHSHDK